MEHELTVGCQNCKIGPSRESRMAVVTKIAKKKTKQKKKNKTASSPEPLRIFC